MDKGYDQLFLVPFHGDTLVLAAHNGEPHVVMRSVVENLGLAWQSQHIKLTEKFGATITIIVTVADDGRQREMVGLPLRKFPAWLYSINPNKVAPELREKVTRYQEECDEVLWQYWTKGFVGRPGVTQPTITQQLNGHGLRMRMIDRLEKETHPVKRAALHEQITSVSQMLSLSVPLLDSIGRSIAQPDLPGV